MKYALSTDNSSVLDPQIVNPGSVVLQRPERWSIVMFGWTLPSGWRESNASWANDRWPFNSARARPRSSAGVPFVSSVNVSPDRDNPNAGGSGFSERFRSRSSAMDIHRLLASNDLFGNPPFSNSSFHRLMSSRSFFSLARDLANSSSLFSHKGVFGQSTVSGVIPQSANARMIAFLPWSVSHGARPFDGIP